MKLSQNTKFFNGLSLRVVMLFGIAIVYSLLMDRFQLKDMLDEPCERYVVQDCNSQWNSGTDYPKGFYHTHWSSNHWLYFWMNIALMLVQFIRIMVYVNQYIESKKQ